MSYGIFRGSTMSKKAKIITAITTVVAVFLIGFFSYQSYTHTSVKQSEPSVESNSPKASSKDKKTDKSKKDDSRIFLQDQNNPDRVIGIHPQGTNGVYQYRKQSNGNLYPEYKFFNGEISRNKNQLTVKPTSNNSANSFSYKIGKDGTYTDANSNETYVKLNDVNDSSENYDDIYHGKDHGVITVGDDYANPSHDQNDYQKTPIDSQYFRLNNNDYIAPHNRWYHGFHFNTFDVDSYDPSDIIYNDANLDKVMYWKNNGQTHLSQDELAEDYYFNLAMKKGEQHNF